MERSDLQSILAKFTPEQRDRFWLENPHLKDTDRPEATQIPPEAPKPLKCAPPPASEAFQDLCVASGLPPPVPEHRFHPTRRWRMDYAWPDERVALEVQGGIFVEGRHSRGAALLKEWEKLGEAACMGWRFLFCQPKDLTAPETLDLIRRALDWKSPL